MKKLLIIAVALFVTVSPVFGISSESGPSMQQAQDTSIRLDPGDTGSIDIPTTGTEPTMYVITQSGDTSTQAIYFNADTTAVSDTNFKVLEDKYLKFRNIVEKQLNFLAPSDNTGTAQVYLYATEKF